MRILKLSTAYNLSVFMTDSTDHVTGKTGLTLTVAASKDGAAFASISPTVTERGNGWYSLALTTSHTDTVGDLALHITATGADPADLAAVVRARVTDDLAYPATSGRSLAVDASGQVTVGAMAADSITASAIAADAIGSSELAASAITEIQAGLSTLDAAGVRTAVGLASANLDTQIATLATASSLSTVAGYVDTEVAAIKAKTDALPASPAATGDIPSAATIASQVRTELATELARVDVAVSTRGTGTALDASGVRAAIGLASANLDTQLDALPTNAELSTALAGADDAVLAAIAALHNLSSAGAQAAAAAALAAYQAATVGDVPTAAENADTLLGRNIAGASDGGRIVTDALRVLRNKVTIDDATATVYAEDDTTPAWTGSVTRAALDALQTVDPA